MKWYASNTKPTNNLNLNGLTKNTFLVLSSSKHTQMGLKLVTNSEHMSVVDSTRTWPITKIKRSKPPKMPDRPQTATLEKPEILNENLMYTLDMSIITKELLQVPNLCQMDKVNKINKKLSPVRQLPSSTATIIKRVKKAIDVHHPQTKDTNNNNGKKLNQLQSKKKAKTNKITNNNKILKTNNNNIENTSTSNILLFGRSPTFEHVREPCQTCGRVDQPERFHSHPSTPRYHPLSSHTARTKSTTINQQTQNQNQKIIDNCTNSNNLTPNKKSPYLSKMNWSQHRKSPTPNTHIVNSMRPLSTPRKPSIKTCYLCGKEFGSASLPFHESKCLERWERENAKLPPTLRRNPPPKPKDGLSTDEWNEMAWKSSQSTLIPCENCNRTFLPDRLEVHQRSCRPENNKSVSGWASPGHGPPTVECYICKRKFGTRSIAIHEPQCLKKWHAQNNQLPPTERMKPPVKPAEITTERSSSTDSSVKTTATSEILLRPKSTTLQKPKNVRSLQKVNTNTGNPGKTAKTESPKRKRTIPCYLCGRQYIPSSLKFHEPECLKKWHNENNKLPLNQRRKEPTKPDIIFTETGKIDYDVASDENWKTHLSQLIPCSKCARKFFPDRVAIHENSCKG